MPLCQFCGSRACEWADDMQLGCSDCGYELPEGDDPYAVPFFERPIIDNEVWALTNQARDGIEACRQAGERFVFNLVCRTAIRV